MKLPHVTEQTVLLGSMISITVLVVAGLVVLALDSSARDTVIPLVSVGVTAIASFSRRPTTLSPPESVDKA